MSNGNVEAFSQIYRLYYNKLLRYGVQIIPHKDKVEDVIQDFFAWLAEHHQKCADINNFEVYLYRSIKRNLLANQQQAQRSQAAFLRFFRRTSNSRDDVQLAVDRLMEDQELQTEKRHQLAQALQTLPAHQREIIYLRYYEGLDYDSIAAILGVSNQVARNYASRAIKRLKLRLKNVPVLLSFFYSMTTGLF